MAVRKDGNRWIVEFMFRGVRIFRRLPPGRNKGDAQQLESKLRNQIFDAVDLGKLPDPLLSKVIDEWLQVRVLGRKSESHTRSHARWALAAAEGTTLGDIVAVAGRLALGGRRASGDHVSLSAATINRRLCILKAVAKYAYQKGYIAQNLSAKITLIREDNKRHVYLSKEQVAALIAAADNRETKAFIAWAAFTGMRQSEILALRPEDVKGARIVIHTSKTGLPRIVPLVPELAPYLDAIPFTRHKRTIYAGFEAARGAAGMPGLHYHDLRHTAASMLINSGADLYTVGQVLGHKSTQTTSRYAHLNIEVMRTAMERAFSGPGKGSEKARGVSKSPRGQGKAKTAPRKVAGEAGGNGPDGGIGQKVAGGKPRKETGPRRRGPRH